MFWETLDQIACHVCSLHTFAIIECYQNIHTKIEQCSHNREQALFLGAYLAPHSSFDSTLMTSLIAIKLKRLSEAYLLLITVIC